MKLLTQEQINFFKQEGYLTYSGVYSPDEISYLRDFFTDLFKNEFWKKSPYDSPYIINDIYRHFPHLIDLIFKPNYINVIKELLGDEMVCVPECAIHHNRYFDWHRDTSIMESVNVFTHKIPGCQLVQGGIYLQDNLPEGGGLMAVPRSNKGTDRFKDNYYGTSFHKIKNKILKLIHFSIADQIEKYENPILLPSNAGDVLFFDSQLDHRANFIRGKNGNPIIPSTEKFAIFNSFTSNLRMAQDYNKSIKSPNEPYAEFLRQTTAPEILIQKASQLNLKIVY